MFISLILATILIFFSLVLTSYEKLILRENKKYIKNNSFSEELTSWDIKKIAFIFALFAVLFLRYSMPIMVF